mgnify:CR=1 FL=1
MRTENQQITLRRFIEANTMLSLLVLSAFFAVIIIMVVAREKSGIRTSYLEKDVV